MRHTLFFLIFIFPLHFVHAQQYGWVQVAQVGNQFSDLQAVEFVDSMHGWLYGFFPAGYRYTLDGGNTWLTSGTTGVGFGATSISMLDTVFGWAAGDGALTGGIARTTNGGVSWVQQRLLFDRTYIGTASLHHQENLTAGYVQTGNDTGKVVQTSNGGTTWTERTIADSIRAVYELQFIDSVYGWALYSTSGGAGILRTTTGGTTWVPVLSPHFQIISFIGRAVGFGVLGASCYRTIDSGFTWTQLGRIELLGWDVLHATGISFADSLYGWAYGFLFYQGANRGAIFRSMDGGITWNLDHLGTGVDERINAGIMIDHYHGWAVGTEGQVLAYRVITSVPEKLPGIPKGFALRQNYPNPFNPTTSIEYEVVHRASVSITIYDVGGRKVGELTNAMQEPGVYRLHFDGSHLATGVYYYTLRAGAYVETKQMTLLK